MVFSRRTVFVGLVLFLAVAALVAWQIWRYHWIRGHYDAAKEALQRRDFRQASAHLSKCVRASPNDPSILLLAAQAARRQGDLDLAGQRLSEYREAGGPSVPLEMERRLLRVQGGNMEESPPLFLFCQKQPDAPEAYLAMEALIVGALNFIEPSTVRSKPLNEARGEVAALKMAMEVVDWWTKVREGAADQVQALVWRGRLHLAAFDLPEAQKLLREALERDPDHVEARLALAFAVSQKSPKEALEHLELLYRRDPTNNQVRLPLARVRRALGQFDEARVLLDEILEDEPDRFAFLLERGRLALDENQPDKAEKWLRRAVQRAPNSPEALFQLATSLRLQGKTREWKKCFDRAKQLSQTGPEGDLAPPPHPGEQKRNTSSRGSPH